MLLTSVPPPVAMARPVAVSDGPSTSDALASSWAWVMRCEPLSSAIAASVTGVVTGASLTGVMSSDAEPLTLFGSATPLVVPLSVMV